jgi:uncharacterized protein (TIGR02246 family)
VWEGGARPDGAGRRPCFSRRPHAPHPLDTRVRRTLPLPPRRTPPNAADDAAVRRLLDQINEAWARGDAEAYASFHTPDADLIDFRGVHARGREGIIGLLQPAFDGVLKGTRVEARIVDLRFLTPDVAIFHTEGQIVPTGAASIQTFVATKGTDGWAIAAFQNTRIQPPE